MAEDDEGSKVRRLFPERPDPEADIARVEQFERFEGGTRIVIWVPDRPRP
ncbi:hypothetical protein [Amnibacterium kyonggiense]